MWRRCVRTVLFETYSSDAISGALRLLGRYRTTRSSASLSALRSGAAAPGGRTGPAGEHLEDLGEQRRVRRPVPGVPCEALPPAHALIGLSLLGIGLGNLFPMGVSVTVALAPGRAELASGRVGDHVVRGPARALTVGTLADA